MPDLRLADKNVCPTLAEQRFGAVVEPSAGHAARGVALVECREAASWFGRGLACLGQRQAVSRNARGVKWSALGELLRL